MKRTAENDVMFRPGRLWLSGALAVALGGCGSSNDSGGRSQLLAFNAVPDVGEITFLREEEVWTSLPYGGATSDREVDADEYIVHFETRLPDDDIAVCAGDVDDDEIKDDDECTRIGTETINLLDDNEYVVVLLGEFENRRLLTYDKPIHEFDDEDTDEDGDPEDENMEIQFFNWSNALGPVDVYLEPPGTNLSAVQVRATLDIGQDFDTLIDKGDYVLTLTAVGDPTAEIFTSEDFELIRQTRVGMAILESSLTATSPVRVEFFRDRGGELLDRRAVTELRATHTSTIAGDVDIYGQGDFTAPLYSDLAVNEVSEYIEIDPTAVDDLQLDITPAGNPGALLARETITLSEGNLNTFFLIDESINSIDVLPVQDRFRRLFHYAEIRLINSFGADLDYYVVPAGDNIFTSTPLETLSVGTAGILFAIEPGNYDIVLAREGTDIFVFGPLEVSLDSKGAYTLVAVATPDSTAADVIFLDDFNN